MRGISFIGIFFLFSIIIYGAALGASHLMDCRYIFAHQYSPFKYCWYFNDWEQKTNFITNYHGASYTNVILGTSRAAAIDVNYFSQPTINMALTGSNWIEQRDLLRHYVTYFGSPQRVYIFVDFRAAFRSDNAYKLIWSGENSLFDYLDPVNIRVAAKSLLYFRGPKGNYCVATKGLTRICSCGSRDNRIGAVDYPKSALGGYGAEFNASFVDEIADIVAASKESEFRILLTPITESGLRTIFASSYKDYFQRFTKSLVDRFGMFQTFYKLDGFTGNAGNFHDWSHLCADSSKAIVESLENDNQQFGLWVDQSNVDEYVNSLLVLSRQSPTIN